MDLSDCYSEEFSPEEFSRELYLEEQMESYINK